ncbi:MAG: CHAT domain-containing protein [Saprospiraceae bacterium]|nr:CHAT domain-containing protein [Saprospiraceae bacterium]MCF8250772.1 CHAT domain-containing protein [Saprospiraceae bacterium]MCF8282184.1 CHAT domain-containing protein [Bacteroidales bacterium]MCF8312573.1 CHAT domain-containing protein [Saprospiraceae bacterium]MCF8440902.1 CHAT domain-containing protein [Saprospiraceae bacterium]
MKTWLFPLLLIAPLWVVAQTPDSTVMKQLDSLIQVSQTLAGQQDFDKALEVNAAAEKLALEKLGRESAAYGNCCFNHGQLLIFKSDCPDAEKWLTESKIIREKVLGKEDAEYALSLSSLGNLYWQMGNYEKSEPLYLEAKDIRKKALGKAHPDYATSLHTLADYYFLIGQIQKSSNYYLEALEIRKSIFGENSSEYASVLLDYAVLLMKNNRIDEALLHIEHCIQIYIDAYGENSSDYAASIGTLGEWYKYKKQYDKALPLIKKYSEIIGRLAGESSISYSYALNDVGAILRKMYQYSEAEPYYLEVVNIRSQMLGDKHPEYGVALRNLCTLYMLMGEYEKAEPYYVESSFLNREFAENGIGFLSESEFFGYNKKYIITSDEILFTLKQLNGKKSTLSKVAFDNILFYKGFVLNASMRLHNVFRNSSSMLDKYELLIKHKKELAQEYTIPVPRMKNIQVLTDKIDKLEKELARGAVGFSEATYQVNWEDVQKELNHREAVIEFIQYKYLQPEPIDSIFYTALLLRPGDVQPLFVPLFEEKQLTEVLMPDKSAQASDLFSQIYSRGAQPLKTTQLTGLYELIWQPLDSLLKGVETVYYSPSGLLHRINFDAVPIDEKEILSDHFQLVRLGSTRSLVVPDLTKISAANDAVLFGGIQYEMDTTSIAKDTTAQDLFSGHSSELSFTYADRSVPERGNSWNYLQGTGKEVSGINTLLKKSKFNAQVFSGDAATEESFKSIGNGNPSPQILHIATHGFFFPDPKIAVSGERVSSTSEPVFKISDHPMIRSGLILAGGNYAWHTGKPFRPDIDDGILTAYEISQMNLSNTELVVLSACETGLGDIKGNEGVYGLQRAFKIAGAKYLVMSLWQVPDIQTQELMTTFYAHWLEQKMTIPDAFRSAQQEMREKFQNPYFWAGFVMVE